MTKENNQPPFFLTAKTMTATKASRMRSKSPAIHISHYRALTKYIIFFLAFCKVEDVSLTLSFILSSCSICLVS